MSPIAQSVRSGLVRALPRIWRRIPAQIPGRQGRWRGLGAGGWHQLDALRRCGMRAAAASMHSRLDAETAAW